MYSLPFRVALDTKLREFQYKLTKLLNRCLVTNAFLYKIGVVCRQNKSLLSIRVFNSKTEMIYQLETMIAKSNNKHYQLIIRFGENTKQINIQSRAVVVA